MATEFISNKVYYKIFDRIYKQSSGIYCRYKAYNEKSLQEVENNLQAIKKELGISNLLILKQIHSNIIIDADNLDNQIFKPEADGIVTTKSNLILPVMTADCVPVLFSSAGGEVIGAAHCGWRSSKLDIIKNIVELMTKKGAHAIKAVVGPAIQQNSYEVDQNFYNELIKDDTSFSKFFVQSKNENHYMFDLPSFILLKLTRSGVKDINIINEDTYSQPSKYPSYRRSSHLGEQLRDHILSTIYKI